MRLFYLFFSLSLVSVTLAYGNNSIEIQMQNCELGNNDSCNNVGNYFNKQKKRLRARFYYKKACERDNAYSCIATGHTYLLEELAGLSRGGSKQYYYRACELGVDKGCSLYKRSQLAGY